MNEAPEKFNHDSRLVLIVSNKNVKTVKTALERTNQLDRSSKITSSSTQHTTETKPTPAPILKFDPVSGQYIEPKSIDAAEGDSQSSHHVEGSLPVANPLPLLEFDPQTGTYRDPSTKEQPESDVQGKNQQVPILQFDLATGQYVDPAVLAKRDGDKSQVQEARMRIPTTIPCSSAEIESECFRSKVLKELGFDTLINEIEFSCHTIQDDISRADIKNPLHKALKETFETELNPIIKQLNLSSETLLAAMPDSYLMYKPMLLLPHNAFSSAPWEILLATYPLSSPTLQVLWTHITKNLGVTHVAMNSPIPAQTTATSSTHASSPRDNILRSPINITPIHGFFGPSPTPQTLSSPTTADFAAAFWVSTIQNGIHQTWAPLYTMFSRGNIREKTRILNLPSVARGFDTPSSAVVDMYAGIGYFAFSYKKAGSLQANGIEKVVGFELNPWSVEGLRRGAQMNGWTCRVWTEEGLNELGTWEGEEDFWIFQMSNERAVEVLRRLGGMVSPVRHVNLGLLPSSVGAWQSAVLAVGNVEEAWIHVHENVATDSVDTRAGEIEARFAELVDARAIAVTHVERVKMYAPGVVHCVFDVQIGSVGH